MTSNPVVSFHLDLVIPRDISCEREIFRLQDANKAVFLWVGRTFAQYGLARMPHKKVLSFVNFAMQQFAFSRIRRSKAGSAT